MLAGGASGSPRSRRTSETGPRGEGPLGGVGKHWILPQLRSEKVMGQVQEFSLSSLLGDTGTACLTISQSRGVDREFGAA